MAINEISDYMARAEQIAIEAEANKTVRPVNSERQKAIAALWHKNYTTKVIAKAVGCSIATVNNYRKSLGLPLRMPAPKDRGKAPKHSPASMPSSPEGAGRHVAGGARG